MLNPENALKDAAPGAGSLEFGGRHQDPALPISARFALQEGQYG